MNIRQLADIALKTGEIMLSSGGEIYRVQDTIDRVFASEGKRCDSFVLLSGIFISTIDENGHDLTLIKRIDSFSFDLHMLEEINEFSRMLHIKKISYVEALKLLDQIKSPKKYSLWVRTISSGIIAFAYTLLFNGTIPDAVAAFTISFTAYPIKEWIGKTFSFQFMEYFLSGLITGLMALLYSHFLPYLSITRMLVGAIMIMVPGIAITTGLKDALHGDTVSSIYRLSDAIFISVAVGAGVAVAISLGGKLI